jgi:hypothetical protein
MATAARPDSQHLRLFMHKGLWRLGAAGRFLGNWSHPVRFCVSWKMAPETKDTVAPRQTLSSSSTSTSTSASASIAAIAIANPNKAQCTLTSSAMHSHFPTAHSLVPVESQTFYCKDSRGSELNFGAPGGDFGELLLAMDVALKRAARRDNALAERLFGEWIDEKCSATRPFYMHTDAAAWERLCSVAGLAGRVHPLEAKDTDERSRLLRAMDSNEPSLHGCGHLRLIKEQPEAYTICIALMNTLLLAFFRRLWRLDDSKAASDVLFKIYPGALEARGLVVVYGPDELKKSLQGLQNPQSNTSPQGLQNPSPNTSPQGLQSASLNASTPQQQLFILNQHATRIYRRDHLAPFLAARLGLDSAQLFAEIERKGWENGGRSADALASNLPLYRVDLVPEALNDAPVEPAT